jgi:hypothetical protein
MNLDKWHNWNDKVMQRNLLRRSIKELKEELHNREEALKRLEAPKLAKWWRRQTERIEERVE